MATTPKKELTEAEQYAAEEQDRIDAIAAKKEADETAAAETAGKAEPKAGTKPAAAKPATKPAPKAAAARPRATKAKDRIEVYEQRGPRGLFKVTRNIDTGETSAELIDE